MKSLKLTKHSKEQLARKLLTYRFAEKSNPIPELLAQGAKLAHDIYVDSLGKDLEKVKIIPDGWLPSADYIQVSFPSDKYSWIYFNGSYLLREAGLDSWSYRWFPPLKDIEDVTYPVPANLDRGCFAKYDAKHPITVRYNQLVRQAENLGEDFRKHYDIITAALDEVRTTKQLLENWPEIEPFLLDYYGEEKKSVAVAIPVKDLNQMFELPKELAA